MKNENASIDKLRAEIVDAASRIPLDHPDNNYDYDRIIFMPGTYN